MYDLDTPEGMERAKIWMLAILSSIREGGQWTITRSLATYTIYHSKKEAHRPWYLFDAGADRVLRELGWTVYDPRTH